MQLQCLAGVPEESAAKVSPQHRNHSKCKPLTCAVLRARREAMSSWLAAICCPRCIGQTEVTMMGWRCTQCGILWTDDGATIKAGTKPRYVEEPFCISCRFELHGLCEAMAVTYCGCRATEHEDVYQVRNPTAIGD